MDGPFFGGDWMFTIIAVLALGQHQHDAEKLQERRNHAIAAPAAPGSTYRFAPGPPDTGPIRYVLPSPNIYGSMWFYDNSMRSLFGPRH
jgi:hypothetical protein